MQTYILRIKPYKYDPKTNNTSNRYERLNLLLQSFPNRKSPNLSISIAFFPKIIGVAGATPATLALLALNEFTKLCNFVLLKMH